MLQSKDKKKKFLFYVFILFFLSSINNLSFFRSKNINFKVNNIEVIGLNKSSNFEISKSLNQVALKNIFFLKRDNLSKIIEKNSLVQNFIIKKVYPDTILVKIKKTKYVGIIIKDNKKFFIGSNAKLILFKEDKNNLPYVFGKVDLNNFLKFIEIIQNSNFKYMEINEIYYFPSGRWDVKTKEGILFRFPEKNLSKSLNFAHKIINNNEFKNHKIIDLRVPQYAVFNNG